MPWTGGWLGGWLGSWLGSTAVPALGPDGRLIAIPFQDGVTVKLTWATDILKAVDGTEHRAAVMTAPRVSGDLAFVLENDDEVEELRGEIFRHPDDLRLIPILWDALRVRDLNGAHLTVPAGHIALWDWTTPGQRVYVYNTEGEGYEAVLQEALAIGTLIKLDTAPFGGGTFLDGETFIAPLLPAYLLDGNAVAREQVNVGDWTASAIFTYFSIAAPAGVVIDTYDGNFLLDDDITPLAEEQANEKVSAGIDMVDFGSVLRQRTLRPNPDIARAHMFQAVARAELQWWRAFFWNLQGRFETFLLPSFRDDFTLFAPLDGSANVYITAEIGGVPDYVTNWFPSASHRYLRFEYASGSIVYRKVVTAEDIGDGSQKLGLNATLAVGAVDRISYAEVCRLASDEVAITFYIGDRADIPLQALAVQQ